MRPNRWPRLSASARDRSALAPEAAVVVTAAGNDDLLVWDFGTGAEIRRIASAGEHLFATSIYSIGLGRGHWSSMTICTVPTAIALEQALQNTPLST